jgi:hypothetical protein
VQFWLAGKVRVEAHKLHRRQVTAASRKRGVVVEAVGNLHTRGLLGIEFAGRSVMQLDGGATTGPRLVKR